MDSPFEGAVLDPVKCSKLSMEERREIVYELANWSHGAAEMLQSWSRQDILQILCAEMGKERKYTGLTKLKIIEHLMKVVSEKKSVDQSGGVIEQHSLPSSANKASKRPRKPDNPSCLPVSTTSASALNGDCDLGSVTYCKNAACKARLCREDKFCRRCTCCICHKYDDNKDPSLWLTCSSEPPFPGDSCNLSCHLECALKHERSGIARNGAVAQLDGSFYCVSCGKMNDLMRCWRKQLMVAKDTRRVDILCYRISLSQKLLSGTKKYQELSDIMDDAVKQLETEVGTLSGVPVKMGRGIVNRLSTGPEVQRLCAAAVASFDLICGTPLQEDSKAIVQSIIRVEDVTATSVTVVLGPDSTSVNNVGYSLWHHKAGDEKEIAEPTCTLCPPQTRFIVSQLSSATEYVFKVVSFANTKALSSSEVRVTTSNSADDDAVHTTLERSHSPITNCSSLSNPSSVEDETNNIAPCGDMNENKGDSYFNYYKSDNNKMVGPNSSNEPVNSTNASQDQNPSCASDEEHAIGKFGPTGKSDSLKPEANHQADGHLGEAMSTENRSQESEKNLMLLPCVGPETSLPITPCRPESLKDGSTKKGGPKSHKDQNGLIKGKEHARSLSQKRTLENPDEDCVGTDPSGENLEYCIKVIRWLECEGHLDKSFRQKFLTWYSIRASSQETRIVKAFVDTLIDDPASLSEQLMDTFGEIVSSKRSSVVPPGFCLKLWH